MPRMQLIVSLKETGALGGMFLKSARQIVSSRVVFTHSRSPADPGEDKAVSVRERHATHEPTASSLSAHPRATALSRPLWAQRQQHRSFWKPWKNSGSQDDLTDECHLQAPQHRPVIAVPAAYCTGLYMEISLEDAKRAQLCVNLVKLRLRMLQCDCTRRC
jgi:hypothetical protein